MGTQSEQKLRHAEGLVGIQYHEHRLFLLHLHPRALPPPARVTTESGCEGGQTIET